MTQRRVVVTLEIETDVPLDALGNAAWWRSRADLRVKQAQANVMLPAARALAAPRKRKRRR